MSTRDWKIGEVVYLKSGSPAMTVIGTDSHGATTVRWYDPQAVEVERSMYPTVVFPKDCLTESVTPQLQWEISARMPQLQAEPIRIVAPQSSNEELTQNILTTLQNLFGRVSGRYASSIAAEVQAQPNEKIVEAMPRAAETARAAEQQRTEQATAQTTAQRQSPSQDQPAQPQRQASPDGRQSEQPPRRKGS